MWGTAITPRLENHQQECQNQRADRPEIQQTSEGLHQRHSDVERMKQQLHFFFVRWWNCVALTDKKLNEKLICTRRQSTLNTKNVNVLRSPTLSSRWRSFHPENKANVNVQMTHATNLFYTHAATSKINCGFVCVFQIHLNYRIKDNIFLMCDWEASSYVHKTSHHFRINK